MNQEGCNSINPHNISPIGQSCQELQKENQKLKINSFIETVIVHKQKIIFFIYFIIIALLTIISFFNNYCQNVDYIKLIIINSLMWFLYFLLYYLYCRNIKARKSNMQSILVSVVVIGLNVAMIELFSLLYNYSTSTYLYEDYIYKEKEVTKSTILSCDQGDFTIEIIFQMVQINPLIFIFIAQINKDIPSMFGTQKQSLYINFLINAYYFIRQIIWQTNQSFMIAISIIYMIYLTIIDASSIIQIPQIEYTNNNLQLNQNNLIGNDSQLKYIVCDFTRIQGDQTNLNISNNQSRPNGLILNHHISEIDKWTDQQQKQSSVEKQTTGMEQFMENSILNMLPHGIGLVTQDNELLYTNESINTIFNTNNKNLINVIQQIPAIVQQTPQNSRAKRQQFEYSISRLQSMKEDKSPSNNRLHQNENKIRKANSIRNVDEQFISINFSKSENIGESSFRIRAHSSQKQQNSSSDNNKIKSKFFIQNNIQESRDKNHSILTTKSPLANGLSSKNIFSQNHIPYQIEINKISKSQRALIQRCKNIQEIMQVLVMENEDQQMSSECEKDQKHSQQKILLDQSKELNEQNGEATDSFIYQSRNRFSNDMLNQTPIDRNNSKLSNNSKTYEMKSPIIGGRRSSFTMQSNVKNNQRYHYKPENLKSTKKEVNILCIDKENQLLLEVRLMKCQISVSKSYLQSKPESVTQEEEQKTYCILIMCEEISEKVYMNKAMRLATYKSKMLASISHELRTPLNCSIGMLQMIYDNDSINKDILDNYITPALYSNRLLLNIINDILDYNQINAGNFKLNFTQVFIRKLVEDTLMLVRYSCQMKKLNLSLVSEDTIDNNLQINSDPQRITQILLNLLNNAIKFTEEGGQITVSLSQIEKGVIKIDISDTGCGIPFKKLRNIFNNFGKGAGLGLTISNKLAKGVGNKRQIKVVTQLYKGSTFTFFVEDQKSRTLFYKKNTLKTFFSQRSIQTYYDPSINQRNNLFLSKSHKTETILSPLCNSDDQIDQKRSDVSSECQLKSIRILDKKDFSNYRTNKIEEKPQNERMKSKPSLFNDIEQSYDDFSSLALQNDENIYIQQQIFKPMKPKEIEQLEKQDAILKERLISISKSQLCPHCPQILIVDDNEFNILTLKCYLNQYELKSDIALNGQQALQKVQQRLQLYDTNRFVQLQKIVQISKPIKKFPDEQEDPTIAAMNKKKCKCINYQLIFMDIDMPVMNGFQSSRKILELYDSHYPLIKKPFISTCSAFVTDQDKEKAKESGMLFFLEKPIVKKKLEYLLSCIFITQQTP